MLLVAILACVAAVPKLGGATPEPQTVVNGVPDADDEFPAVVVVRPHVELCSGVIVSETQVLTAAHCVDDLVFGRQLGVYSGASVEEQAFLQVQDYETHPEHCPQCVRDRFDFALIQLREPVNLEAIPRIPAQPREWEQLVSPRASVTAVGFGLTPAGPPSERQILEQSVVSVTDSRHEFSVTGDGGTCKGDSGGPILVQTSEGWELVGIMSRASSSACDGAATTRVGSTTAALCWLSDLGLEGEAPSEEFCRPDPERMGCGGCGVGQTRPRVPWSVLLLALGGVRRRRRAHPLALPHA